MQSARCARNWKSAQRSTTSRAGLADVRFRRLGFAKASVEGTSRSQNKRASLPNTVFMPDSQSFASPKNQELNVKSTTIWVRMVSILGSRLYLPELFIRAAYASET